MLLLLGLAYAATLEVCVEDGRCPYATLGDAVSNAGPGDTIRVHAGTYTERLSVSQSVTIEGVEGALPLVTNSAGFQAGEDGAVIAVFGDGVTPSVVTLRNLAISTVNSRPLRVSGAELVLEDVFVTAVGVTVNGGALYAEASTVRIDGAIFQGNRALRAGGHIYGLDASVTVRDTRLFDGQSNALGGAIAMEGVGELVIAGGSFEDNRSFGEGGAIALLGDTRLEVSKGTAFRANEATIGGAISVRGAEPVPVTVRAASFRGNTAADMGGAVHLERVVGGIETSTFLENDAGRGGGVYLSYDAAVTLADDVFCGNRAIAGGGGAVMAAAVLEDPQKLAWERLALVENTSVDVGGAIAIHNGAHELHSSWFLGNSASSGVGSALYHASDAPLLFRDNLVAWSPGEAVSALAPSMVELVYDAWHGNGWDFAAGAVVGEGLVQGDPLIYGYVADGDCDNDRFSLGWESALRDAGSPGELDPDGSRRDIGIYGGEGASDSDWQDADGDGTPALYDCSDVDSKVHPGAAEVFYDGRDQDCDRRSDFDADRDGADSDAWGGDDCDDDEPTVHRGAEEVPHDGIDQDCDGVDLLDADGDASPWPEDCDDDDPSVHPGASDDDPGRDVDCDGYVDVRAGLLPRRGCATSPGGGWLLVLLLLRRRRYSSS